MALECTSNNIFRILKRDRFKKKKNTIVSLINESLNKIENNFHSVKGSFVPKQEDYRLIASKIEK